MCSEPTAATVRVWSPAVRLLHWALVASVGLGLASGFGWLKLHDAHAGLGYAALAIVALRTALGLWGSGAARFAQFVRGWRATTAYARALRAGQAPRYLGHNPLGGWMTVLLLGVVGTLAGSGALLDTDAFWGDPLLSSWHAWLAWALIGVVGLHLAGVGVMSRAHREPLVLAMLTGRKRAAPAADRAELPD